ncbi:RES family NAD+ phosphorylase [Desulfallas thermosapovorans]|uniref:RES domain-containing protein n=1 Tax=Desulfallas thermosapovorans DSM 6562 TaxID=1121431 RepID=A0A5S4ZS88_9FIRM|nr:RES family NAD+ phosphorylase [Desulfallas thermosapovorans]TYO95522.1 RES domain-containing protein [Desulfallas thermosapovorans DSM 6562]
MNYRNSSLCGKAYVTNDKHTREKYSEFAEYIKTHGLDPDSHFVNNNIFLNCFLLDIGTAMISEQDRFVRIARWCVGANGENFAPDPKLTKAGRLNPKGVVYLYLSNDKHTAISETKIKKGERFCIGVFRPKVNLRILDFCCDRETEREKPNSFRLVVDKGFSKPIQAGDDEKEYMPTQFLAKYIKGKGFDGVKYSSAACEGGYNVCLFATSNVDLVCFECKYCECRECKKFCVNSNKCK